MAFWNRRKQEPAEARSSLENPSVAITHDRLTRLFGLDSLSEAGVEVTTESALTVPAIWDAVNFLSGTIAGLPLFLYEKDADGNRTRSDDPLAQVLHDAASDTMSSFEWRKYTFERVFTTGRAFTEIERSQGSIVNLRPLDPSHMEIKEYPNGRREYRYQPEGRRVRLIAPGDILDIPFMLRSDPTKAYGPISTNKDVIGLGIAATNYGSKFFQNGGVPPFAITGPFQTGGALDRASGDLQKAVQTAARDRRLALSLPEGHTITSIGADPDKSQLVELKKFLIEEYARIYQLPPTFLQDLSNGTYSNTEQQDLHFVKHTVKRWVEQFEQEMNLKLFGRGEKKYFVEFELDGLLRGDFKTRMEGYATGIQNAITTPAEVRKRENLPPIDDSDKLLIQGATVPLGSQPTNAPDGQGDNTNEE